MVTFRGVALESLRAAREWAEQVRRGQAGAIRGVAVRLAAIVPATRSSAAVRAPDHDDVLGPASKNVNDDEFLVATREAAA